MNEAARAADAVACRKFEAFTPAGGLIGRAMEVEFNRGLAGQGRLMQRQVSPRGTVIEMPDCSGMRSCWLQGIIDTIPQQIWSGPSDGTLDFCNVRWRSELGLSLDELQGDGWQRILHPDDRDRVLNAWRDSIIHGTPYEQQERHRTADGKYRWYLSRGLPLRDEQGRIVRWYGTNTDIEDQKRAEEELSRAADTLKTAIIPMPIRRETRQPCPEKPSISKLSG